MNQQRAEKQLLNEIKQELDNSCDRLDAQTLSRLNYARHQALEGKHTAFFQRRVFTGSALAACLMVLGLGFYIQTDSQAELDIALSELEDIEILSADENLELYEDIEFYQWLSMNNDF
tara:strand:- start:3182 stop:3535 length:354 start_codon:yes stop_codon:yes gene_type:complete